MNIVAVRELAKRMRKSGAISEKALHDALHCPVFLYNHMGVWTDDEIAWAQENIVGGADKIIPVNMPYQTFIIVCEKSDTDDKETNTSIYFVFGGETEVKSENGTRKCILYIVEAQKDDQDGNDYWIAAGYTGLLKLGVCINLFKNGVSRDCPDKSREEVGRVASNMRSVVTRLCYDVMSKTSAVVRASPKPRPDKGVEWHLARTHYCVLTKKQAMEIRDKKGGVTKHQIARAAHWRRAHFRTLRSEKFTKKRNQKVPVIEAWVGPDTWLGLDGKIYKVIL